jgi:hypothetical protein
MGRKRKNTIQRTVNMHPSLIKEVRDYAKRRTSEEISKEAIVNHVNQKTE